jgi:hypothetical protein
MGAISCLGSLGGRLLSHINVYGDQRPTVRWAGELVDNRDNFRAYLADTVCDRLYDVDQRTRFEMDMRALATSDMAVEMLERLLGSEPEKEPWEVGEALAECLLETELPAIWPSHTDRDKRTPKASLLGQIW